MERPPKTPLNSCHIFYGLGTRAHKSLSPVCVCVCVCVYIYTYVCTYIWAYIFLTKSCAKLQIFGCFYMSQNETEHLYGTIYCMKHGIRSQVEKNRETLWLLMKRMRVNANLRYYVADDYEHRSFS
jgi:hypothetical protein